MELLLAIGENINSFKKGFENENILLYKTKEECIKDLTNIIKKDDVILVKASRGMKLEDVTYALEALELHKGGELH